MSCNIEEEPMRFSYTLIDIAQADYQLFLKSDNPEVQMLGILANFGSGDSYSVVKEIIEGIQAKTEGEFAMSRYFKQLRIFVQLRSEVGHQFERIMETITAFFKEEKDYLFRKGQAKGIEKGIEKGKHEVVENLITELSLPDDTIARLAEVSLDFVKKVRTELVREKK